MRRAGRVATGVDRVEIAYLQALLDDDVPCFGLARTSFGYVLLDQQGLRTFERRLVGGVKFSSPDLLSRLPRGLTHVQRQAQTDLRKLSIGRALPRGLPGLLQRHLPAGTHYLNIGHSNITDRVFQAVKSVPDTRIAAFVHDIIPLEYPEFQRDGSVGPFAQKIARVGKLADLVIYNSVDTQSRTEAWMQKSDRVPDGIVAHLGIDLTTPDASQIPANTLPDSPYFVTVGTIEPRKNHALLLDIWETLGPEAPILLICGGRGWNNEAVFNRLDSLGHDARVKEVPGLSDTALAAVVQNAQGLLFPSHAEGFGLPAIEALTLGTPVLCSNIATFREVLGDKAVYADVSDRYLWIKTIEDWAKRSRTAHPLEGYSPPTWEEHFKIVLSSI